MSTGQRDNAAGWPSTPAQVEQLNDELAREHPINDYYAKAPWLIRRIQAQRLAIIRDMIGEARGLRVLEIGSGGGHILRMFPESKLTASDVSDVFLETARKNLAGYDVQFLKGQIEKLGLPSASYDRIICSEVLEHTTNPAEILVEIKRLLAPGGHAVITVPIDPVIDRAKQIVRVTPVGWVLRDRIQWGGDKYHLQKWWPWQFQRLLEVDFAVEKRRLTPTALVPLHACYRCRPR
jgi:SAM-dependent methyltransferase